MQNSLRNGILSRIEKGKKLYTEFDEMVTDIEWQEFDPNDGLNKKQ